MLRLVRRAAAKRDLLETADHIATNDPEAAERFLLAVESSFRFLVQTPNVGAPRHWLNPNLYGLRMWPVRGFEKVLIFYRTTNDRLVVVRVLHSARDIGALLEPETGD